MAKPKNTGLGRGLDAIFLDNETDGQTTSILRISEIEPRKEQPRKTFDSESLAQLADSIAANGMIQPIVVRAGTNGYYQIIAGERRWRAAKMAGLTEVPVIITEMDNKKAAQVALIENVQREDLNPVEEASAYRSLLEEYHMTQEEVSRQVGKSRSAVANALRLLDLPGNLLERLSAGAITAGHARALLGLRDPALAEKAADEVERRDYSVRETEKLVRSLNRLPQKKQPESQSSDLEVDYTAQLERRIMDSIGRSVRIKDGKQKKLEITFTDYADLDELVLQSRLRGAKRPPPRQAPPRSACARRCNR